MQVAELGVGIERDRFVVDAYARAATSLYLNQGLPPGADGRPGRPKMGRRGGVEPLPGYVCEAARHACASGVRFLGARRGEVSDDAAATRVEASMSN